MLATHFCTVRSHVAAWTDLLTYTAVNSTANSSSTRVGLSAQYDRLLIAYNGDHGDWDHCSEVEAAPAGGPTEMRFHYIHPTQ